MKGLPARDAPITLHAHPRSGNAYKVALMLALTFTPYRFAFVDMGRGAHLQPDFLALNPYGQVPVLEHGDLLLRHSNLIVQYLADLTGRFLPADPRGRIAAAEWAAFEQDMLYNGIGRVRFLTKMIKGDPAVVAYLRPIGERGLTTLNRHLTERDWIVGATPSIADVSCYPYASAGADAGFDMARFPAVGAWFRRFEALPGFGAPRDLFPKPPGR